MKKFLFLLMAVSFSVAAVAQGKSKGHGNGKNKQDKHYNKKQDSRDDRDDRYEDDKRWNKKQDQQGKIAKNIPTPVANAFYRDFPNAGNVTWTKEKGVWTAHFANSGILNRNNSVSYRSNGQRVDGTYAQQRRTYPANTGNNNNGGVLDKILGRNRN